MPTPAPLAAPSRAGKRGPRTPQAAGLPDPRPITEYTAVYGELDGHSQVVVTLAQPCIIRAPAWGFVDTADGSLVYAETVKPQDAVTIFFDFAGIISRGVAFVDVPYQDVQVQNFQGGFVRPGARWFRPPG